jgi:hypothetical protein
LSSLQPQFFSNLLVSCLRNSLTKSSDTGEDLISGFGPDKGLGIVVSEFDIVFDGLFQFQRAAMGRSFDLSFGEQTKPPFHQIEPRGTGRSEVQMKPGPFGKPTMNQRGFMSPIVVQNKVNLKRTGNVGINGIEEFTKLYRSVPAMQLANDFAGFGV